MKEFIHEFIGFSGTSSRCHIRILDDVGKPIVIMCSQVAVKPGTSITNMAEYIAIEVKKYLERDNISLVSAVAKYWREKRLSEVLDDLLGRLKASKSIFIFVLESIKLALEHKERYELQKKRINDFIWVEHYSKDLVLRPNGSYDVVSFDRLSWTPGWRRGSVATVANYTGYSEGCFKSPDESIKK